MKIFLTGASGYIGGSVANALAKQGHELRALVRSDNTAELLAASGIKPLIGSLDDAGALESGAAWADTVINMANSDHFGAVQTLISVMEGSGKQLIHTSGASTVVDDALGAFATENIFKDDTPYKAMSHRMARIGIDRLVRDAGVNRGIRTVVVCPSMVYGTGRGLHKETDQLPKLQAQSRIAKAGVYIGAGRNIWSNVHIDDLVSLFLLVLENAPSGSFYFAENGEASMLEIAEALSVSMGFGGRTESWKTEDALAALGGFARIALAANCRVRAANARGLGWRPTAPSLREWLVADAKG